MEINLKSKEVSVKVVYYGPGLSGKTTNLEVIHEKTAQSSKGKLSSLATDQDRTLFFDYMPLELGEISGLKIRLRLFTVPGQVYYNSTRQLVLRCVDGVVFVADSQAHKNEENIESLHNLYENLNELDISIKNVPIVIQYNKRDLSGIMPVEYMTQTLNKELNAPFFETVAFKGIGVFQTLKCIAAKTLKKAEENIKNNSRRKPTSNVSPPVEKPVAIDPAPASIKIPGKSKFQLNFSKDNTSTAQSLENTGKLPFKIQRKETSHRIEIPAPENQQKQEESSFSIKNEDPLVGSSSDRIRIRKSNENAKDKSDSNVFEKVNFTEKNNSEKTTPGNSTDSFKKTTSLFKGSLSQSSHINLNAKKPASDFQSEGLKDRLKNINKFKNIFEDQK